MRTQHGIATGVVCLLTAVVFTILLSPRRYPAVSHEIVPGHPVAQNSSNRQKATVASKPSAMSSREIPAEHAELFDAFKRWTEDYISSTGKPGAESLIRTGESLAIQRRAALAELIQSDPEHALQMAVPYALRRELPSAISQHLEERVSGKGKLEVIASVATPGEPSPRSSIDRVVTLRDRTFKAFVYGRRANQSSIGNISLHGIAVSGVMAVHESPVRLVEPLELADMPVPANAGLCPVSSDPGSRAVAVQAADEVFYLCDAGHIAPLAAAYIAAEEAGDRTRMPSRMSAATADLNSFTQGEKSILFMRVNFPDDLEEPISETQAKNMMDEVASFYAANSYGTLNLATVISPLLTLPKNKSWYTSNDELSVTLPTILADARAAAAAAGLPQVDLDIVYVKRGVLSNSRAYVGSKGAWLQTVYPSTAAHEIGHNLGLWHANAWKATDGTSTGPGSTVEYGNPFDTMGSGTGHFNAYHKSRLNWLPASAVQTITTSGVYRLYPADLPALKEGAVHALKIQKDSQREYWIETGQSHEGSLFVNWSANPWSLGGSQLLDMAPESLSGFYDAMLAPGNGFYDSTLGLKIIPLHPKAVNQETVEVLVKLVHYMPVEAETAAIEQPLPAEPDLSASQGAYIVVPDRSHGGVQFSVNIPESGEYTVWARVRGSSSGTIWAGVDGEPETQLVLNPSPSFKWQWSRLSAGSLPGKRVFALSSGSHTLFFAGHERGLMIDCLLIATDDPTDFIPPVISPISNQASVAGEPVHIPFSVLQPGAGAADWRITAQSSDQRLIQDTRIVISGNGINRTLEITPNANQFGTAAITINLVDSHGTAMTKSFTVTLMGPVQAVVEAAAPGDTIVIPEGTYVEQVVIDKDLTLEGAGAGQTVIEGNRIFVPLTVTSNATVVVRNLTFRKGKTAIRNYGRLTIVESSIQENQSAYGGGIWNGKNATLLLQSSTVSSNRVSERGGGIYNMGELTVLNSTISGNRSTSRKDGNGGGGVYNMGILSLQNCTITANQGWMGGGVMNVGTAQARSTILAGNIAEAGVSADFEGELVSEGHNLLQNIDGFRMTGDFTRNIIGQDPLLGALSYNGGPTLTHALLPESPAIDGGSPDGPVLDQRGFPRRPESAVPAEGGDGSDIGAFEYGADLAHQDVQLTVHFEPSGGVSISVMGVSGSHWTVQATSDFVNWETLGLVTMENGLGQIADENAHQSGEQALRFYRALSY